jgi:ParB family chromosome partitioning protein
VTNRGNPLKIKEHGLINPITVKPCGDKKYKIVAGERRFLASRQAGLFEVPCIVKDLSENDTKIVSLVENIQREDLNDIDKANALIELKKRTNLTWDEIALKLGISKGRVMQIVGLSKLPDSIQKDLKERKLSGRHILEIKKIKEKEKAKEVLDKVKDDKLSVKDTSKLVDYLNKNKGEKGSVGRFEEIQLKRMRKLEEEKLKVNSFTNAFLENKDVFLSSLKEYSDSNIKDISEKDRVVILEGISDILKYISHVKEIIKE